MSWVPDKDDIASGGGENKNTNNNSMKSNKTASDNNKKKSKSAQGATATTSNAPEKSLLSVGSKMTAYSVKSNASTSSQIGTGKDSDVPPFIVFLNKKINYITAMAEQNPEKVAAVVGGVVIGAIVAGKVATVVGLVGAKSKLKVLLAAGGAAAGGELVAMLTSKL